ncbi:beta/gamma crystallin-related protein [Thermus caldilimi]|uniref:beta/gamma crystallin-related protein n=1 Tax=Thermus caldilimi TaxID=2483360 RepID=UPI00142D5D80|nr:beta/gamma crystallin-related protein [Thermus caldilimi]
MKTPVQVFLTTAHAMALVVILFLGLPAPAYGLSMGYHYDLIREAMRQEGFGKDAFSIALAANSYTDLFQEQAVEWVIDDDFARASKQLVDFLHFDGLPEGQWINRYWRQLIHNTHAALTEKVRAQDRLGALMVMGVTLHVVQDFYAHSNWVELDLPRRSGIKDATYFDLSPKQLEPLLSGSVVWGQNGLFTHWEGGLSHDALHKDHAGKPYFDQAYRCAYKASLQWLRLMRKWIVDDMRKPDFWNSLQGFQFTGNRGHLYTLTNFDEGTIRWLSTYGGAWKTPRQWGESDIFADDMPNVPGIGITQQSSGYPFLGREWFSNASLIARDLFEVRLKLNGTYTLIKLLRVENLNVVHGYVDSLLPVDNAVISNAISFLAKSTQSDYYRVKWLRVRIPEAMDLDTGAGWDNVNNEEVGGTSDYWVMFIINGETEHPYTEAEYVDSSHSYPVWGVIKPLWGTQPVRVQIHMFESDPTNHKDEEMDIAPGDPKAFLLEFDPETGSYGSQLGYQIWRTPGGGYFIKSDGTGDMRARIYVSVWMMEDFPQPPSYPVFYADRNYDGLFLPVLNDRARLEVNGFNDRVSSLWIPPWGWSLDLYEHSNYQGRVLTLTHPEAYLNKMGWEDRISSVRAPRRPQNLPPFAVLWDGKDFTGAALPLLQSLPNLSTYGFYAELDAFKFNDKTSSIEVPIGWTLEVYEHPHFEGKSTQLTGSVADLSRIGWDNRISSVRVIPSVERREGSEREAILAALGEALKRFPDEDPAGLGFRYERADVRLSQDIDVRLKLRHLIEKDGWAWVEAQGENYAFEVIALLHKEGEQWRVKGVVNPAYVACPEESVDVLAFLYRSFQEKLPQVPTEIFPEVHPEREAILHTLQGAVPIEKVVFLVKEFSLHAGEARLIAYPRTPNGLGQFEPLIAVLRKDNQGWEIVDVRTGTVDHGE